MRVLGILGSPRKEGNTDILLQELLKGARSKGARTEEIYLPGMNFKGCIECGGCNKTGICILKDDMTPIYAKLRSADIVILASPIFFAGVTAQLKAMIDRCQSEWVAKYVLKKRKTQYAIRNAKGVFICVGGFKKDIFFQSAKKTVEVFFRTLNIDFKDELFFGAVEKAGDIKNVKGALEKAYKLGVKLAGAKR